MLTARYYIQSSSTSLAKKCLNIQKYKMPYTIAFCEIKVQSSPSSPSEKREMRCLDFELPGLTTEQEGRELFACMCFH